MNDAPMPPEGLGPVAMALWREIAEGYVLADHEVALLREIVRTVDALEGLDDAIRQHGLTIPVRGGGVKASPLLCEQRQLRIVLARLVVALRIPLGEQEDDSDDVRRPQRRGLRGVYEVKS